MRSRVAQSFEGVLRVSLEKSSKFEARSREPFSMFLTTLMHTLINFGCIFFKLHNFNHNQQSAHAAKDMVKRISNQVEPSDLISER